MAAWQKEGPDLGAAMDDVGKILAGTSRSGFRRLLEWLGRSIQGGVGPRLRVFQPLSLRSGEGFLYPPCRKRPISC